MDKPLTCNHQMNQCFLKLDIMHTAALVYYIESGTCIINLYNVLCVHLSDNGSFAVRSSRV